MMNVVPPLLMMVALIAGLLVSIEVGHRIGKARFQRLARNDRIPPTLEAAIFGLLGLLIAFTFGGAGTRFDARRGLIAQEANTIGTAYLRIDLLPPELQPAMREDFRKYLSSRIEVFRRLPDLEAAMAELNHSAALQTQIWERAVEATRGLGPAAQTLFIGAINEMIDITTIRTVAAITHTPAAVFAMLALSVITAAALAGYEMASHGTRDCIAILTFTIVVSTALYVIVDYEYPRAGLIREDGADRVMFDTLEKMK